MVRPTHQEFKNKVLQDPEVRAAYEDMQAEFNLINQMITARKKAGLTQSEIAKSMQTSTSAVSRLESAYVQNSHSPSIATLKKYAKALGFTLEIRLKNNTAA